MRRTRTRTHPLQAAAFSTRFDRPSEVGRSSTLALARPLAKGVLSTQERLFRHEHLISPDHKPGGPRRVLSGAYFESRSHLRLSAGAAVVSPPHSPVHPWRLRYTVIWLPISTTRPAGMWKKSVGAAAFFIIRMNSRSCQLGIRLWRAAATTVRRPRKNEVVMWL